MKVHSQIYDVLIVGSGPSGVQAAVAAVATGAHVGLVDIGHVDERYAALIPDRTFADLHKNDANQGQYFLGDADHMLANLAKAGAHLTPPRQYMIQEMDRLFPLQSETFVPLQSTSQGGLGVSWGANVFTLEDFELHRAGLPVEQIRQQYEDLAKEIGISGPANEFGDFLADVSCRQPPLDLDTNAAAILKRYNKARTKNLNKGFRLGQSVLAMLSKDQGERHANPLNDMDFYSDAGCSVYRPQFTLQALQQSPNFTYLPSRLALSFKETDQNSVQLKCKNIQNDQDEIFSAGRLLLAAGAINSGKLVLRSQPQFGSRLPILCNPNHWVAAVNLSMLGRPAADARHSLAQLTALQRTNHDSNDYVLAQFYSYRSLFYFRMLRSIPLPPTYGVTFLRLIATALTCVNLHFSDTPADSKYIQLKTNGDDEIFSAHYQHSPQQQKQIRQSESLMLKRLLTLRCIPLGIARPAHGASIHYAGTLPTCETDTPFHTAIDGRLHRTKNVYIADGSCWKFLPAKGLTFTLMANARRVAQNAVRSLQR